MEDKAKSVSKELVSLITATEPRTQKSLREDESVGEDKNRHGEKEINRGRRVREMEM